MAVHDEWKLTFSNIAEICKCSRPAVFVWYKKRNSHAAIGKIALLANYINRPIINFFYDNGIHLEPEKWPTPTIKVPLDILKDYKAEIDRIDEILQNPPYSDKEQDTETEEAIQLFANLPRSSQRMLLHLIKMEHTHCLKKKILVSQREALLKKPDISNS
jgi:hypothetical protein